jgi:hypothetical protein
MPFPCTYSMRVLECAPSLALFGGIYQSLK